MLLPLEQLLESLPGASYWTPLIFSADEYSVAWAGAVAMAASVPAAAAVTARALRIRMRNPPSVVRMELQEHTDDVINR